MSRVAKPGDPDLDFDVDGVTIDAVVVLGDDVMVEGTGSFGWFEGTNGRWEAEPGEEATVDIEMTFSFPGSAGTPSHAAVCDRLNRWWGTATPLRICAAPGRLTTVIEDASNWIPLPRKEFPDLEPRTEEGSDG